MRDYKQETEKRVAFIKRVLEQSGAQGIVFGNSGGKDSALVGILCRMACENLLCVMMPCGSKRNYGQDLTDAKLLAERFSIPAILVDLTAARDQIKTAVEQSQHVTDAATANIAPRLRMTALYAVAQSRGYLVAGTGNKSEATMGYFTKWGDGAYDFNPIADLTVREIYEFLEFLDAPREIIEKAPSAALYEGQTDEAEMGITYAQIDAYLLEGVATDAVREKVDAAYRASAHKRTMPPIYSGE